MVQCQECSKEATHEYFASLDDNVTVKVCDEHAEYARSKSFVVWKIHTSMPVVSEVYINMDEQEKAMIGRMVHAAKLAKSEIEGIVQRHIKKPQLMTAQDGSALAIALGQLDGIISEVP